MADVEDFLIFRGSSDGEAEDFVRAVRIQAFKAGKHDDPKWICAFAATALAGKALRWYLRLPASTQQDWLRFQDAILEHKWGDSLTLASNLVPVSEPVPAAAPPPGTHPSSTPITSTQHPPTQRTGRIRITAGTSIDGYLSKTSDETQLNITPDKSSAARIVYDSSQFPCILKSWDFAPPFTVLSGLHLDNSERLSKFGPGETGGLVAALSRDPSEKNSGQNINDECTESFFENIWIVCEDRSLLAVAPQAGCIYQLTPVALKKDDSIILFLSSDPTAVCSAPGSEDLILGTRLYIEHEE